jgi:hypothetical protein
VTSTSLDPWGSRSLYRLPHQFGHNTVLVGRYRGEAGSTTADDRELLVVETTFNSLIESFTSFDVGRSTDIEEPDSVGIRPGAYLLNTLGLSLTSVGLSYGDGFWAKKYLQRVDTRSSQEMLEWDRRSLIAWARRNLGLLSPEIRSAVRSKLEPNQELDDDTLGGVASSVDWSSVGRWGPGDPTSGYRLRRLKGIFLLTRLVDREVSAHAAFSFMIAGSPALSGDSPLTFVATFGRERFEEALLAAARYLDAA